MIGSHAQAGRDVNAGEARGVVMSPARIDAWLAVAKAGDQLVYATRCLLPIASVGATRMRALSDEGVVNLCQRRTDVPGERNYCAQRTSRPLDAQAAALRKAWNADSAVDPTVDLTAVAEHRVLAILDRRARLERPCPSLTDLAQLAGLKGAEQARTVLRVLVEGGVIRASFGALHGPRQVTIVSTGRKTA